MRSAARNRRALGTGAGSAARAQSKSVAFACRRASRTTLLIHIPARCRSVPVTSSLTWPARRTSLPTSATRVATCSVFVPATAVVDGGVGEDLASSDGRRARHADSSRDASSVACRHRGRARPAPRGSARTRTAVTYVGQRPRRAHATTVSPQRGTSRQEAASSAGVRAPEHPAAPRPRLDHRLAKSGTHVRCPTSARSSSFEKAREHREIRRCGGIGRLRNVRAARTRRAPSG